MRNVNQRAVNDPATSIGNALPLEPASLLRRSRLAEELTKAGFPVSSATLATQASRDGGPPYHLWGRTPLYRWSDALAWARDRLTPARRSTSESDAK